MLIGHAPAGYLLSRRLSDNKYVILLGLLGSVLPDIDMLYFYWFDGQKHHHHEYWSHIPYYWFLILLVVSPALCFMKRTIAYAFIVMFINIFLHLLLDTMWSGGIQWFYPFSDNMISFMEVSTRWSAKQIYYGVEGWIWNFVIHPSFLVELLLFTTACTFYIRTRHEANNEQLEKVF